MNNTRDKHPGASPHRKWQEAALITPVVGMFILMPPFISIFSIDASLFGIPLIVLYIFVVWALLILMTRFLSAKLMREYPMDRNDAETDGRTGRGEH